MYVDEQIKWKRRLSGLMNGNIHNERLFVFNNIYSSSGWQAIDRLSYLKSTWKDFDLNFWYTWCMIERSDWMIENWLFNIRFVVIVWIILTLNLWSHSMCFMCVFDLPEDRQFEKWTQAQTDGAYSSTSWLIFFCKQCKIVCWINSERSNVSIRTYG